MTLIIPADPETGIDNDVLVRTTVIDGAKRVSVIDVIKLMINTGGNPHDHWSRVTKSYPEILDGVVMFKFPGAGQRETATLNARGLVLLLNVFPGKRAAYFRMFSADVVVRYLGGDQTLIAEIQKNNDLQRIIPDNHPMSMFAEGTKRTRDDFEVQDHEVRILHSRIEALERVTSLLKGLEDGTLDGPMKLLLQDAAQNSIAPLCTRLAVCNSHQSVSEEHIRRHQMPISDFYCCNSCNGAVW